MDTTKIIGLEEHYLPEFLIDYWEPTVVGMSPELYGHIKPRLLHTQSERTEILDAAGIDHAVLSVAGPGVQAEHDIAEAVALAKRANDDLAVMVADNQARYSGFAHLPMQSPVAAADELRRCVDDLGFVGAMVNGHTHGVYLDDESLEAFWETANDLAVPIYLHPTDPPEKYVALRDQPMLRRPAWEWTVETATHALRLVLNSVFDRHPNSKIILGHMGETLPFLLWRFDSRAKFLRQPDDTAPLPSEIIRRNVFVTISGSLDRAPLKCAIDALGAERIMFASDYPFEAPDEASAFIRNVNIPEDDRAGIMSGNAINLLGLDTFKN